MSAPAAKKASTKPKNRYPIWAPRFWHGMLFGDWIRFAWRNKSRFHFIGTGMAGTVSGVAMINSVLHGIQQLFMGRSVARTEIDQPPLFVIGHWRSGTTMLHEMVVLDERFAYPTTYECFAANHFLLTGWLMPKLLWFLLPSKRPMDNMAVSFDHPQEDEFALLSMGAPTPFMRMAFPNDPPPYMELLDMEGVDDRDLVCWKETLLQFVRMQTYVKHKPLVLKSPPHLGRVKVLSEMFPGAKFIHIVREPYSLFASTRRLWYALDSYQAFQSTRNARVDDFIFDAFERMYGGFERQREQIDSNQICDVNYESLVQDPFGEMQRIYDELDLGGFENVRPQLEEYVADWKDYRPNQHELEPEIKDEIRRRWSGYFERYGYDL